MARGRPSSELGRRACARHGLRHDERRGERRPGARGRGECQEAPDVDALALQHQPEVEPLRERQHQAVLEGGVEGELEQQVLGRGQHSQLAASLAPPGPEALAVERIEPRRRHDAPVQLEDPVPFGVAIGPRVIAARHLRESGMGERPRPVAEALEREQVDVRHRAVRFDAAHRLGEHGSLERQRPDPARLEQREPARGEADLPQRAHEQRAALRDERREDRLGPGRPLALERREQQRGRALLAGRREHRLCGEARWQRRQRSTNHELADEAPRF